MLQADEVSGYAWPDLQEEHAVPDDGRPERIAQALTGTAPIEVRVSRAYVRKGTHLSPYGLRTEGNGSSDPERDAFLVQVHYAVDAHATGKGAPDPVVEEILAMQAELQEGQLLAALARLEVVEAERASLRRVLGHAD